jgi:hypothetical protein
MSCEQPDPTSPVHVVTPSDLACSIQCAEQTQRPIGSSEPGVFICSRPRQQASARIGRATTQHSHSPFYGTNRLSLATTFVTDGSTLGGMTDTPKESPALISRVVSTSDLLGV